jgi:hypothetical protein
MKVGSFKIDETAHSVIRVSAASPKKPDGAK